MMLNKITGPGFFRLFLALAVFVHHTTRFAIGPSAVYIFFCLSGYWIYKMYIYRYSKTRQPFLTYAVSRLWRLLPTFWLVTFLTFAFLFFDGTLASYWDGSDKAHFVVSNLIILGYHTLQKQPIVPAWSLDIEMQFYVLAPLLAMLFAWRKISPVWLLLGFAVISLTSYLLRNPFSSVDYLFYFTIGMAAASADWRPSGKLVMGFLGAAVLMIAVCAVSPWHGALLLGAHPGPLSVYNPHLNVVLALLMIPYAIYTTRHPGFRMDGMFADLSYIVYLLHWAGTMWINSHAGSAAHRLGYMVVGWVVVIGLSILIWKFYDRPINRLRSRWVSKRKIAADIKPQLANSQ
jgi:peptidoglycan/LPS O-acetylase OafA/YrhL